MLGVPEVILGNGGNGLSPNPRATAKLVSHSRTYAQCEKVGQLMPGCPRPGHAPTNRVVDHAPHQNGYGPRPQTEGTVQRDRRSR